VPHPDFEELWERRLSRDPNAFREAIRRDPKNEEAKLRLRTIGQ